ncbi:ABC multidrug transporter [Coleophoma cylindrospora]|uniref:ABC multidrug transporter n=1 Tax=Coleophoma cylindrospora TaxID=1849047 RepID=A0A3D8Q521_9HELO|nr:ABC multidrug transporter [Coleophoma cylindrospora]
MGDPTLPSDQMGSSSPSSITQDLKAAGDSQKKLTVTFEDVSIRVHGKGEDYGPTVASVANPVALFSNLFSSHRSEQYILRNVTGQVRPGEMLLVVGRPGSGCTSLLKVIANQRESFPAVDGNVHYGNMGPKQAKKYRHQIVMNSEDDIHHPTLTVNETLGLATATKVPGNRQDEKDTEEYMTEVADSILDSLGIPHTKDTLVGNEFVRGVSGGERKRVSLAEIMATQSPVQCWDNSTRGLDARTAVEFVAVLRKTALEQQKSIIATLYQAGNGIFDLFDKVLVLCEGREIYYGPAISAKAYFEDMGFECAPGANIADFLTSVTVPTERVIKAGFEDRIPRNVEDFELRYKSSGIHSKALEDIASTDPQELALEKKLLETAAAAEKNRSLPFLSRDSSVYTVSLWKQIQTCTKRQFQIILGDKWSTCLKIASALVMGLVTSSLFYNLSTASDSIFLRPGALFFPILLFCMNSMSETAASFMGRPILARHKQLAFYRPAALSFASVISDIPVVLATMSLFQIIYYFMVHFQVDAGKFFTNWFINVLSALTLTSFFRMVGAWSTTFGLASQISGWSTMIMMIYTGYLIPFQQMHVWFRWIAYINPAYFAFEAVMGSEFGNLELTCQEPQYIPYGPGYTNDAYRSCTVPGTSPGSNLISGESYIQDQYKYYQSHVWSNVGILIGFWLGFAILTAIGLELAEDKNTGSMLLYKRGTTQQATSDSSEEEKNVGREDATPENFDANSGLLKQSLFTFKDLSYYVNHQGAEKQLLQKISGFVKPGQLVALMGSSGAGKTTLMDVLAQRKDEGRIEGSILVNGKPQSISFQRTTGYCEQNDVHEGTATVKESLLFSARLRQNFEIPDQEKQDYVERIMELLELGPIQDAIVGVPGSGLSIEQRKRLTLATELVAKPSLLFLDEPTSGLDGQSAFSIVRFMRKLAESGQAVICTIHQPSAVLFEAFDVLLLLAKGGKTTYFGPTGKNSAILLDYFARNGAPCKEDVNPAEHIVDVVQGKTGDADWPELWLASKEHQAAMLELDELNQRCTESASDETEDTRDFATPKWYQIKLLAIRQTIALWRNPDYVWNKILLHIFASLFGGFTFWMIGGGSFDLQLRLFAILNFIFVAPGVINQLQPLFLHNRDIFETREKKSKTYHWLAFISAQLVSEIPLLVICGTLYFCCWYFTAGFPVKASTSGQVYVQMILYELLYTALGQAIAAYSPNEYFAALANPIVLGAALINFCGIVVPYKQIPVFWRYWMYWLDPFTYLVGGLLEPILWNVKVTCHASELTEISLPSNTTCGDYMASFLSSNAGYVVDPANSTACSFCPYSSGSDYAKTLNINASYYGWRDVGITALFCISTYGLVFLMMKVRNKATKTAE